MTGPAFAALVLLPAVAALVIWTGLRGRLPAIVCLAITAVMAAVSLAVGLEVESDGPQSALSGWVYVDELSVIVLVLISVVGLFAALNSQSYLRHDVGSGDLSATDQSHYYALFLAFMATMAAVPMLNNLGIMWVAMEATTICSVLLISLYRTGRALEAAWKYLVLGSVGIALALFGTMMTYYAAAGGVGETTDALNWTRLQAISGQLEPDVMRLAFVFVLIGYGTKVGLAPLHTWLPDAHSQAPSPVSGLLSGVLLNCAVYAILRFKILTVATAGPSYTDQLMIGFGLLSIAIAVPFILVQHDIKRMLAYSSVEHMGIIVLAVGIGGRIALFAAMLHLVAHALTKSSLFFAAGFAVQAFGSRSMNRMRGLLSLAPLPGAALLLGAVALVGMPPFAMFTSEYGLLLGAIDGGRGVVGALGILFAAFAAASLLYHVITVSYREPRPGAGNAEVSLSFVLSVSAPLALLLWLSVAPPAAFESILNHAVDILEVK
jgi:hydrogenase-4 component F